MRLGPNRSVPDRRRSRPAVAAGVAVAALSAVLLLSGCATGAEECGAGSSCALTLPVPTSTDAAHTNGQLTGLIGTLETSSRSSRLCVALRQDDGTVLALVLPPGTSAAVTDATPADGPLVVTLIGANGLGGTRTGDRVAVTPDHETRSARVGGCARGHVVDVGWLIRLPAGTPTPG